MAITFSSYWVSRQAVRSAIVDQELPLAASNIYAEIQKDFVRHVQLASTMANNTFLRDWMLHGERDVAALTKYLREVKGRYGAFTSFVVSERTANYYTGEGILKKISPQEPRDRWYYRVRGMQVPYEISDDPDMAHKDAMTIFINYRMHDPQGHYLGVAGVGITFDAVHRIVADYQKRYQRTVYFVDAQGRMVLADANNRNAPQQTNLSDRPGLARQLSTILAGKSGSYDYHYANRHYLLNVHYIPELQWYLFVEKDESEALSSVHRALYVNLLICSVVMVVVLSLAHLIVKHYQRNMELLATTDELTGLLNRRAFFLVMERHMVNYQRDAKPFCLLLIDIDHFKTINDRYGHDVGDQVLRLVAELLRNSLRRSDIAVRWGGEEFLVFLQGCEIADAMQMADALRLAVEQASLKVGDLNIQLTLSVGVSGYADDESTDACIQRADMALYEAKKTGRNRVCSA
ncbi:GGDEF domain-containing protein [Curvibacter sp. CHRR-16]|uniref:sensor domain-containing diguanylate cyclase n=1 Tax=Curvibacter sp. CHRR-16 TaxID=2835872 RepID=UPI001BDB6C46|nr:sensor domain-containing diguanylate cyclase [Curvibacter sp. CHRR-16]MBT0568799.1 GGDEF domain-containing protein [Curvibacter sp. CHRR-16]